VGAGLILSACQTTENKYTAETATVLKSARSIGYYLGYNEVCGQFKGIRVDALIALDLKEKYRSYEGFQRGYERNAHALGGDRVTGFNRCEFAVRSLELTHAKYFGNASTAKSGNFEAWKKTRLSVGDYNIQLNLETPGYNANTTLKMSAANLPAYSKKPESSRHISEYFEVRADQYCRLSFRYDDHFTGVWIVACEDGVRGDGTFSTDEKTRRTTATGKLKNGGDFNFILYPRTS